MHGVDSMSIANHGQPISEDNREITELVMHYKTFDQPHPTSQFLSHFLQIEIGLLVEQSIHNPDEVYLTA